MFNIKFDGNSTLLKYDALCIISGHGKSLLHKNINTGMIEFYIHIIPNIY